MVCSFPSLLKSQSRLRPQFVSSFQILIYFTIILHLFKGETAVCFLIGRNDGRRIVCNHGSVDYRPSRSRHRFQLLYVLLTHSGALQVAQKATSCIARGANSRQAQIASRIHSKWSCMLSSTVAEFGRQHPQCGANESSIRECVFLLESCYYLCLELKVLLLLRLITLYKVLRKELRYQWPLKAYEHLQIL